MAETQRHEKKNILPQEREVEKEDNGELLGSSSSSQGSEAESEEKEEEEENMALCILLLKRRVHYLPVITFIFIIGSFIASYFIAFANENVDPIPYISHTGAQLPERCIFSQLVNIGAFLLGANMYVRFLQQKEQFKRSARHACDRRLCIAALVVGWLSAAGLSILANFQTSGIKPIHYAGAILALLMGLVYCWIQTSLSWRHHRKECVTYVQLANSILLSACLLTYIASKGTLKLKEHFKHGTKEGNLKPIYVVSTVSQWMTAISVMLFLLTFYPSFSKITLQAPRVLLHRNRTSHIANGNAHNGHATNV
ncbi:DNA damage-regulated autophagy modulator protein 2-like isoform X2 [Babylonia areolata]|uniref:DNA damage-regulated autophagy modulator protein 2-like isoform X2 n=1 Tax=Babylonia areolata TaxID=304850 RepID=UPI003FD55A95